MKESPEIPAPPLALEELAGLLGCSFAGDGRTLLTGVANLKDAREGDLVFFSQEKLRDQYESTRAAAAIVLPEEKFTGLPLIFSSEPHPTFVRAVNLFFKPYRPRPGIHPLAHLVDLRLGVGRPFMRKTLPEFGRKFKPGIMSYFPDPGAPHMHVGRVIKGELISMVLKYSAKKLSCLKSLPGEGG